MNQQSCSVS